MSIFNLFLLAFLIKSCACSAGDHSPYFQKCLEKCSIQNCTDDGMEFTNGYKQPFYLYLTRWTCDDECEYECMWKTVDAFHERNWRTPQFYGKWPFIRFLGIQEPASTAFSILNFFVNFKMIRQFDREVKSDSPLYMLWHVFCLVNLNAWFWSTVFHTRDNPLTELFDYSCAFSIVLMTCFCMVVRILRNKVPRFIMTTITVFFIAFFINHVAYLRMTKIDYTYNMQVNLLVGSFTGICWFIWCYWNKNRQPYVWKCAIFVALTGVATLLEIVDRPPIFYILDFHSLWHFVTAFLIILFYSFAIDDCNYLRKIEVEKKRD